MTQTALDQAIAAAQAAEQAFLADQSNIVSIQAAITAASAPLAAAQTQLNTDTAAYNAALQALSVAALAAVVPAPAPPAPPAS